MKGQIVALGDLYQIGSSKRVLKSQWKTEGVPFYRGREITRLAAEGFVENELFISEEHFAELAAQSGVPKTGDIVITAIGTIGNAHVVRDFDRFYFKDASVLWMKKSSDVSSEFINLWLKSPLFFDQLDRGNGATVDTLTIQKLQSVRLCVPSLAEQLRIVAILDDAFAGIEMVRAAAEQNLQNARALFQGHLQSVFSHIGEGWIEKPFEDCIENVKYTIKIQRKDFLEEGGFPIVSQEAEFINGYWNNSADVFNVTNPIVLFGDHTKILKYIDFDFVLGADGVKILSPKQFLHPKFFFYALKASPVKSLGYARHYRLLKDLLIRYPETVAQQSMIADGLDQLLEETQRLEALYQCKLEALDELKRSLLHQAFSGQL